MNDINLIPEISIVSTIYNDESIVSPLVTDLIDALNKIGVSYEIILVNDGSTDESEKAIKIECSKFTEVKGISLARNFGQQIAMSAGMRYAKGNFIVIMDGDLQNPPSEIESLYNEIKKGFDIVYTVSKVRDSFLYRVTSQLFWFVVTNLFGVKMVRDQLMMKIMTRSFIDSYNDYSECQRTVASIIRDISSNYSVLEIENKARTIGKSHYNFRKRFNLMVDVLISLSNAPLNIMIHFGWIIFLITNIASLIYIYKYIFQEVDKGFTPIILTIFFFGSLIILLLGFIGRYLSNIYSEVRNRPLFHVKRTYNLNVTKTRSNE